VLTLSVFALARLFLGLSLPELPMSVPSAYVPLSGGVWAVLGLASAAGLWLGTGWAPRLTRGAACVIAGWYWADRLLLVRTEFARQSRPAALIATLVCLAAVLWILRRPAVRGFFRERNG
jgi:hypothetical protein